MNQPSLYPDQISRDRYIKDYNTVRPAIVEFETIYAQINEMNRSINQQSEELENLSPWEKLKVMKWFLLAIPVLWTLADKFIAIGAAPDGKPSPVGMVVGYSVFVYIGLCGLLWFNCKFLYRKTKAYQEELEELEEKRQEVSNLLIKRQAVERDICSVLGYVPSKYLNTNILPRLHDFMRNNGATTLAEAITMYDNQYR